MILGVPLLNKGMQGSGYDLNNLLDGSVTWGWQNPPSNIPYVDNGVCFAFTCTSYTIQISFVAVNGAQRGIYIRARYYDTWESWHKI